MRKRWIRRTSVLALASALSMGQIMGVYAAAGSLTAGNWEHSGNSWRHVGESGDYTTGWVQKESGWYYLNPADGIMLTGWQVIDGKKYYFNTVRDGIEGKMRTGWLYKDGDWYFLNTVHDGTAGVLLTGWHWIDGYCYYFETEEGDGQGRLYMGRTTPDGYSTDADGHWIDSDGKVQWELGKGISSVAEDEKSEKKADGQDVSGSGSDSGSSGSGSGGNGSSGSGSGGTGDNGGAGSGSSDSTGDNGGAGSGSSDSTGDNGGAGSGSGSTEEPGSGDSGSTGNEPGEAEKPGDEEKPGDDQDEEKPAILLDENETKLVDLGWAQYVAISFASGSADDYTLMVDGTDITDACTKVDDDGTVVKWEITSLNPESVTAIRNSDSSEQTVTIGSGNGQTAPEAGNAQSAPAMILTNGAVSRFDYYLDVYDKDGNVRTAPEYTTFDIDGERNQTSDAVPSDTYSPDTPIDADGNGDLVIKLALKSEEQEKWFEGLSAAKALNNENSVLNDNLPFETEVETAYGTTGVIRIPLPQTNFYSRGRYQVNLKSAYNNETLTVPVHLVDNRTYSMYLSGDSSTETGGELIFDIKGPNGETFGTEILSPIYRVDLTMPSGEKKTLTYISEWFEIGDKLFIYGTNTENEIVTSESGVYQIDVYSNGYQSMSKKVKISSQIESASLKTGTAAYGVDAVSSASLGGSGSEGDSDSTGSGVINAFLLFDHDLLANAMILEKIGLANADAEAVLDRWRAQSPVSVMDENAEVLYDFTDYLNAVKDADLESGEYLSFSQYKELGRGVTQNRPYQVKRVLEDGLLGSTFRFGEAVGMKAPKLEGTTAALTENMTLTCSEDGEYFSRITGMTLDGITLRTDDYLTHYALDEAANTLVIYAVTQGSAGGGTLLTAGEHTLCITAEGYQTAYVTLTVEKALEQFDLSLMNNPKEEDSAVYYTGQDVYILAASAEDDIEQADRRGDFLKNLTGVTLRTPDGISHRVTSDSEGQIGGNENYVKGEYMLTLLGGLFTEPGEYMVTAAADGYTPKMLTFTVLKAEDAPEDPAEDKQAPDVKSVANDSDFFKGEYYRITFEDNEELSDYLLSAAKTVTVNGTEYDAAADEYWAAMGTNGWDAIGISPKAVNMEETNTVVIEAEGYTTVEAEFYVDADGKVTEKPGEEPEEKQAPEIESVTNDSDFFKGTYYRITFADNGDLSNYLAYVTRTVTVNGTEYDMAADDYWFAAGAYSRDAIAVSPKAVDKDAINTVVIETEGYTTVEVSFYVDEDGKVTEEPDVSEDEKEAPAYESVEYKTGWDSYYRIAFENTDDLEVYLSNTGLTVTVNGNTYEKASVFLNDGTYKISAGVFGPQYLDISDSEIEEGENTVVIEADGYQTVEIVFTVDENGKVVNESEDAVLTAVNREAVLAAAEDAVEAEAESTNVPPISGDDESEEESEENEAVDVDAEETVADETETWKADTDAIVLAAEAIDAVTDTNEGEISTDEPANESNGAES